MAITQDTLEQALSAYLSCGPLADPDFDDPERKITRWQDWLSRLNGQDIPVILEAAVQQIEATGFFDTSDVYLCTLLECLGEAGHHDPERYLYHAERHRHSPHRTIFLYTAGAVYSDDVIDWLLDIHRTERLTPQELRLLVGSLMDCSTEHAFASLGRVIACIPAEDLERDEFLRLARSRAAHTFGEQ